MSPTVDSRQRERELDTEKNGVDYYLSLPYGTEVMRTEQGYFARVPDLPGCITWANTFEELGAMIEDAKLAWIEDALEDGDRIPEPRDVGEFSGKVNLRMPRSLHRDLVRRAEAEGVSLNQYMTTALARSVGP